MDISAWNNLIQCVLIIVLHVFTIVIISAILFQRYYHKLPSSLEASPAITLFFIMQLMASGITIFYAIYILMEALKIDSLLNIYVWVSIFNMQKIFFIFLPLSVVGVGIDRCLSVLHPLGYTRRKWFPLGISGIFMAIFLLCTFIFILPPMYPTCDSSACANFSKAYVYVYIRYGTSVMILTTTIILMILFRKKFHIHLAKNITGKTNKVILTTLLTTFAFDFVPHIFISLFYTFTGLNIASYIGPGSTTIGSLEAILCALLYSSIFKTSVSSSSSNHKHTPKSPITVVAIYIKS